jgi:hypothetical protein
MRYEQSPPEDPGDDPDRVVEILVAQALDDLDERRVDVPAALRVIAHAAWLAGVRRGRELSATPDAERPGSPRCAPHHHF